MSGTFKVWSFNFQPINQFIHPASILWMNVQQGALTCFSSVLRCLMCYVKLFLLWKLSRILYNALLAHISDYNWSIIGDPVSQASGKVAPNQFVFYCKCRNFVLWALKWCNIWLHSTPWNKVMVVWIFKKCALFNGPHYHILAYILKSFLPTLREVCNTGLLGAISPCESVNTSYSFTVTMGYLLRETMTYVSLIQASD